jgi:hypothetical protein
MLRRGMKTCMPLSGPMAISASIMCCISLTIISRVPFVRPPDIFHNKITWQPSCRVKVWGGTSDMLREFRNSVGKTPLYSPCTTESTMWYVRRYVGVPSGVVRLNRFMMALLMLSTSSFKGVKMALWMMCSLHDYESMKRPRLPYTSSTRLSMVSP